MERVHPANSDFSGEMTQSTRSSDHSSSPLYSFHFEKQPPPPPPPAYVVQVPKDQIYRVPPPQNARLYEQYTRRARRRRRRLCSCLCACACLLLAALVAGAAAGAAWLAVRPRRPAYSLEALAVSGLDGLGAASFSPEFDATVRAENPNGKVGVYYGEGSSVAVSYDGVGLAGGAWPAFYQEPGNVTVFVVAARGSGIRLSESARGEVAAAERRGAVPLAVDMEVPVRLRLGALTTWAVTMRVRCAVDVDKLAGGARVVSKTCSVRVQLLS